jgi:hypothetical protein
MKTPPAPEGTDGVFHAFTSGKVAALDRKTSLALVSFPPICNFLPWFPVPADGFRGNHRKTSALSSQIMWRRRV